MALWSRGSGARSGGICGSPVSSGDEEDVFAYDETEAPANASVSKTTGKKTSKKTVAAGRKPKASPAATPAATTTTTSTKRRRGSGSQTITSEEMQSAAKAPRVMSKKERVRDAPQRFVEYLADQLAPSTQAQYCEEYGFGQGYMLRFPSAWSEVRERREFGEWAQQLGFVASKVHRHLYRISSLNVDIVLTELRKRVPVPTETVAGDGDASMHVDVDVEAEPEPTRADVKGDGDRKTSALEPHKGTTLLIATSGSKKDEDRSLQTFKEHFQRLDQEHLEMLSVAEHDRLLSTIRHEQIADAMEEVLARSSVRKDRDRARRMSKLGRIAKRRLSSIPMRASIMPTTIMEDDEWEDDEVEPLVEGEEEEEQFQEQEPEHVIVLETDLHADTEICETTSATVAEDVTAVEMDDPMVTPRKSPRRSSLSKADFTTPRRSPRTNTVATPMQTPVRTPTKKALTTPLQTPIRTPLRTPMKTPLRTPMQTPLRTPMRTPKRTPRRSSIGKYMPMGTPRRSSIAKTTITELKRWRFIGRNVLSSLFRSGFLGLADLKVAFNVSKMWRELSVPAYAWSVADYSKQTQILTMNQVYGACPRGHYLSDGAYKEVFKVFSTRHKRLEAVSVMDIRAIESTGNQHIVRQEVAHSLLLSELVRSKFSPHFVEIYDVFLARERPQTSRWGSATCRKPVDLLTGSRKSVDPSLLADNGTSSLGPDSLFQYIHMEFCDGGDVEDFIGLQDNKLLPVNSVVLPFFFQMVFSLYSARERLHLRHCDIKLLNFFLKDINRKGLACAADEPLALQYVIGNDSFNVQMPATFSYWVKLADYGTADSNVENLGKSVTLDQFTTLENTPIEFLLEGDFAEQSFAADTFSLGLCFLHLFTGSAPYEEILDQAKCPAPLLLDLKRLWLSGKKNSPFSVLRRVAQDDADDVLMHTLYRYIVLFGLPSENPSAHRQIDRVWLILLKHLRPGDAGNGQPAARQSSRRAAATATAAVPKKPQLTSAKDRFEQDQAQFSVDRGSHAVMQRARERLARVAGARDLLKSLVAFNPAERPSMKATLFHEVFKTMRVTSESPEHFPRPVHYSIDCYAADKIPVDRLPDV